MATKGVWYYQPQQQQQLQRDAGGGGGGSQGYSVHAQSRLVAPSVPFRKRSERVDWKKIASVDVDGIARNLDYNALQSNLANVTYCNIELETDTRTMDPNFVKLFKLSQLSIEYLLHSQEYLSTLLAGSEENAKKAQQEHGDREKQLAKMQEELNSVKRESHKRKKMIVTLQQMLQSGGAGSYHKCPHCSKAFVTAQFLQSHVNRRHGDRTAPPPPPAQSAPAPAPTPAPTPDAVVALQAELKRIQERLAHTEEQLVEEKNSRNSLMQKVKSDQAKHELMKEKDMDKWKDEQLKKHERELKDLRQLFTNQLAELENKYSSEHTALTDLQRKFNKQSHLGELQDEDAAEKRKLKDEIDALQHKLSQQRKSPRQSDELQQQNMKLEKRLNDLERKHSSLLDEEKRRKAAADAEAVVRAEEAHAVGSMANRPRSTDDLTSSLRHSGVVSGSDLEGTSSLRNAQFLNEDRRDELRRQMENNPGLLKQLKLEISGMLALELEKRGIARDAKGIDDDTLRDKMKLLQSERQQDAKAYKSLNEVRQQYINSIDSPSAGNRLSGVPPTTPTQERSSSRQSFNDQQRGGSQRPTSASRQSPGNTGRPTSQTSPRHQSHVQFQPSPSQGQGQRQSAAGGNSYKPAANSSNNNRSRSSDVRSSQESQGSGQLEDYSSDETMSDEGDDEVDGEVSDRRSRDRSPGQASPPRPAAVVSRQQSDSATPKPRVIESKPLPAGASRPIAASTPQQSTAAKPKPAGAADSESDLYMVSSEEDIVPKQAALRKQPTHGSTDASTAGTSLWGSVNTSSGVASSAPRASSNNPPTSKLGAMIDNDFDDDDSITDLSN